MPSLPIGPANIAPPLRCERLEDRSLLSSTTLYSIVGDSVLVEPMPCEVLPAEGVVLEEGGTVMPFELSTIRTADWREGRDGFLTEEEYSDESWYYEDEYWDDSTYYEEEVYLDDSWYYEDETYYEEDWYYEEEYWDDSWYYEDELYYDDSWYYEDETYYEEDWYYEEEYWDDSWYYEDELYFDDGWYLEDEVYSEEVYWDDAWSTDQAYYEESSDGKYDFVGADGMTWKEYEEVWLTWERSDMVPSPVPGDDAGDWSTTLGELTDFDDGMVYAMAVSGGVAIPDVPVVPTITDVAEILPLPLPASETEAEVAQALPPVATTTDAIAPPNVVVPQDDEIAELPAAAPVEDGESDESAEVALAAPSSSDDHLTEAESLELSEDLRVG